MNFYNIKDEYVTFLRTFDSKVAENKNERRPYVGVVFEIEGIKYYAPFSSPKPKHKSMRNTKDFRLIHGGEYGAINFNNMVPAPASALIPVYINQVQDEKYRVLLKNQYRAILNDEKQIRLTAEKLHRLIHTNNESLTRHDLKIKQRCCDLPTLESHMNEYVES